jgi:hypothetical protein
MRSSALKGLRRLRCNPSKLGLSFSMTPGVKFSMTCLSPFKPHHAKHPFLGKDTPFQKFEYKKTKKIFVKFCEGFGFACRLGCQWGYHRAWIVCSPIVFVDFSLVDLIFISRYSWFVLSWNPVYVRYVDSSTLTFSLLSFTDPRSQVVSLPPVFSNHNKHPSSLVLNRPHPRTAEVSHLRKFEKF